VVRIGCAVCACFQHGLGGHCTELDIMDCRLQDKTLCPAPWVNCARFECRTRAYTSTALLAMPLLMSSGGMWVTVPYMRVWMRSWTLKSRAMPKSAILALNPAAPSRLRWSITLPPVTSARAN